MYEAPAYRGSGKLEGMVALITGGDSGIGRAVAVLYAREGADVAITYLTEHVDAEETRRAVEAEGRRCITMAGDVADFGFCETAVKETVEILDYAWRPPSAAYPTCVAMGRCMADLRARSSRQIAGSAAAAIKDIAQKPRAPKSP
jgi:NAD(P)-dependent dehydrogenase (short-subunit alcohol dehydrogenase family)